MGQREEAIGYAKALRELLANVVVMTPKIRSQGVMHANSLLALLALLGSAKDDRTQLPPPPEPKVVVSDLDVRPTPSPYKTWEQIESDKTEREPTQADQLERDFLVVLKTVTDLEDLRAQDEKVIVELGRRVAALEDRVGRPS